MTEHWGHVQGVRTKYLEFHRSQPRTIVFLHGFRGNHRGLLAVAEHLTAYRVIIPDLPGWGESDSLSQPHTFNNYSDFLSAFIGQLGLNNYILAGHSFGASLALIFASRHPERLARLVLIEPVFAAQTMTSRLGELYYRFSSILPPAWRDPIIKSAVLNRISTELLTVLKDPVQKKQLVKNEQDNLNYIRVNVELESFLSFYETDFQQAARTLTVPTVMLAGQRDQMTPLPVIKSLTDTIPRHQLIVMPGAGHFAPMEIPAAVSSAMRRGLDGL